MTLDLWICRFMNERPFCSKNNVIIIIIIIIIIVVS